jgi:hypothetical protein
MPSTYTPIATTTVSTPALNVTFSSISPAYTDLILVCSYSRSGGGNNIGLRLNGDTGSNYSETYIEGDGSTAVSGRNSNDSNMRVAFVGAGTTTSQSTLILHFMNYSNSTTYKTVLSRYNETTSNVGSAVGLWRSTSAINSIEIGRSATVNWAAGSVLTLYGIKAA